MTKQLISIIYMLKTDYLLFLAIIRSFFRDKNFLRYFSFIFCLYFLGIFGLLIADIYYIDDLGRAMHNYLGFEEGNRWLSQYLGKYVHLNFRKFITDISPLTQLLAIAFLSIASMALVKVVNKKITYFGLLASLGVGLSPWYLENLSYKFDSPYMALATTFAILPFLFIKRLSLFFTTSILFLLGMWNLYQANNGIYIVLAMFITLNLILTSANKQQIIKFICCSASAFIVALLIYRIFIFVAPPENSYMAQVGKIKVANFFDNIILVLNTIKNDMQHHLLTKIFYIIITAYIYIYIYPKKELKTRIIILLCILLFLGVSSFMNYGLYLILEKPMLPPRAFCGFGVFVSILTISLVKYKIKFITFFVKVLIIVFAYNLLVIANFYANALQAQQKYSDFRVIKMLEGLDKVANNKADEFTIYISNNQITPRQLNNNIKYLPLINRLVYQRLSGGWVWTTNQYYQYFDYPIQYPPCKEEKTKLIYSEETKFNKFAIYENKCIEVSYK